ncbi:MAG: hypothetical protein ABI717_02805 [Actinomycetota bacterium]
MRASRLIAAGLALVIAAVLALLAADVRAWRDTMRADDLRFQLSGASESDWDTATLLPRGVSRGMLDVDDDRALRRGVAAFRAADRARGFARPRVRGAAEAALAEVAAGGGAPAQASQAFDLLGILAFSDSTSGRRATPVERSLAAFENAVRRDPDNTAAKYNLELLLRLLEAEGERRGPNPAPGPRGSGRRGAGTGTPGQGY